MPRATLLHGTRNRIERVWVPWNGTFDKVQDCPHDTQPSGGETIPHPPRCDGAVMFSRFNGHTSAPIAASDNCGREQRFWFCQRPTHSPNRLAVSRDGCLLNRLTKSSRRASRVRIMTSAQCLARLMALTPPRTYPWTRLNADRTAFQASQTDRFLH